jgi:hypothetical protein
VTDDPVLIELYEIWRRLHADGQPPSRADVDPLVLGPVVLPHIILTELAEHGARLRYRLVGTAIINFAGEDITGRYADELMSGSYLDYIMGVNRECWERRKPVYCESRFRWDTGGTRWARRLFLPLREEVPPVILGAQTFGGCGDMDKRSFSAVIDGDRHHDVVAHHVLEA